MTLRARTIRAAGRRAVEILLWGGAVLGTLSVVAALAAVSFSIVPLVFTSGSMSPDVPTGSLGLARTVPANELRVGDVVSVTASNETRITHRIVAVEEQPDLTVLTLQGDTNPSPDQERYGVTEADRVFFTAPHLGRVVVFLTSPWAMFMGGLAAASLLFWAFRRQPPSSGGAGTTGVIAEQLPDVSPGEPGRPRAVMARSSAALVAMGLSALLLLTANSGTAAVFTDVATVGTTGFATHRVLQPAGATCGATGSAITVGTPPLADARYSYWTRAYTPDGVAVSGYKKMTGDPATAKFTTAEFGPALAAGITYTFRIHSRIGDPGPDGLTGWESEEFRRARFSQGGSTLVCGDAIVPPVIVFTQPISGFSGTREQLQAMATRDCGTQGSTSPGICGTAIDPNGSVVSVKYILQRSSLGTYCWNGSRYPAFGSCDYRDANRNGNEWSIPGDVYDALISWNYTLTIKATDNLGAVSEKSIQFRVSRS